MKKIVSLFLFIFVLSANFNIFAINGGGNNIKGLQEPIEAKSEGNSEGKSTQTLDKLKSIAKIGISAGVAFCAAYGAYKIGDKIGLNKKIKGIVSLKGIAISYYSLLALMVISAPIIAEHDREEALGFVAAQGVVYAIGGGCILSCAAILKNIFFGANKIKLSAKTFGGTVLAGCLAYLGYRFFRIII